MSDASYDNHNSECSLTLYQAVGLCNGDLMCSLFEMNPICKYFNKQHVLESWTAMIVAEVSITCLTMDAKHIQGPYFVCSKAFLTSCRACGHSVEWAMLVNQVE